MKKSRILAILLCLVMLFAIVACNKDDGGGSQDAGSPQATDAGGTPGGGDAPGGGAGSGRDTLSIAVAADSGSLDAVTMVVPTFAAVCCIQEPLWDVTEANEVIMLLAESVDIVAPDEWIIHLRQGVTFSNGNPFTSEDVIFSLGLHLAAGATGGPRVQTIDPEGTKAIDEHTVDLKLWDYHVANWTVLSQFMIYDHASYEPEQASLRPIGTGPYVLTEYVPNSYINLERREDYWGTKPEIKYLNFRILAETSQVVNALETGMIDIGPLATQDVDYVKTMPGFNVDARLTGNYILLGFNFGQNSFFYQNLDARRAVCHAIDPQVIINLVYEGKGEIMHAAVPDICFDYEDRFNDMDETYAVGYNPDVAKQYADASGLTGQTISCITDGSPAAVQMAEIAQNMLGAIGVTVSIQNYDPATVWGMLYDPTAVYDMSIGAGIAPNRRVGDLLVNGVRFSPTMSAPGGFENNQYYLEVCPLTLSTENDARRSDYLAEVLGMYEGNVLTFALCNVIYSNAFSNAIDPASIVYTIGTGFVRAVDLKFAP